MDAALLVQQKSWVVLLNKKLNVCSDTRNVSPGMFLSHSEMTSRSSTPAGAHLLIQGEACREAVPLIKAQTCAYKVDTNARPG